MLRSSAVDLFSATALIAVAVGVSGCGGGGQTSAVSPPPPVAVTPPPPPTVQRPASVERSIATTNVDTSLAANEPAYVAINPDPLQVPKERLFVMLPGTGGEPRQQREFLRTGVARGYHTIGLYYPNQTAIEELCRQSGDANCTGDSRREIITGSDTSGRVSVNVTNSIAGRLTKLLAFLDRTYPTEGWGRFLSGGAVDWSVVAVGGISQGAGHAAYMAKLYSLDRTVMFAGPADQGIGNGTSAAWLSLPNVTPVSRQYGFTHVNDELVPYALVRNNWSVIGLDALGAPASVDGASAPFANSHQLNSSIPYNPAAPASITFPYHIATVVDGFFPLTPQGTPTYAPVWIYLAFP